MNKCCLNFSGRITVGDLQYANNIQFPRLSFKPKFKCQVQIWSNFVLNWEGYIILENLLYKNAYSSTAKENKTFTKTSHIKNFYHALQKIKEMSAFKFVKHDSYPYFNRWNLPCCPWSRPFSKVRFYFQELRVKLSSDPFIHQISMRTHTVNLGNTHNLR